MLSFVDHLAFDKPAPLPTPVLREMMHKEAARLLMPLKGRYSHHQAIQQREADRALVQKMKENAPPPPPFRLIEMPPVPPTGRKKCSRAPVVAQPVPAPAPSECPPPIPTELDLRQFSSYADQPRSMRDVDENVVYQVAFERFGESGSVRFSSKMVHWLKKHPDEGRVILDAFILGRARPKGQNGFKIYYRERPGERVYQIKTHAKLRGLAFHIGGVWQIVAPSHKDTIHLDAEEAKPL